MENRFNETGADFGKSSCLPKSRNNELIVNPVCRKEPADGFRQCDWSDPKTSRRLIKQLFQLVNSKEEYELLERDLAELEQQFPSFSKSTERRCCNKRS